MSKYWFGDAQKYAILPSAALAQGQSQPGRLLCSYQAKETTPFFKFIFGLFLAAREMLKYYVMVLHKFGGWIEYTFFIVGGISYTCKSGSNY